VKNSFSPGKKHNQREEQPQVHKVVFPLSWFPSLELFCGVSGKMSQRGRGLVDHQPLCAETKENESFLSRSLNGLLFRFLSSQTVVL